MSMTQIVIERKQQKEKNVLLPMTTEACAKNLFPEPSNKQLNTHQSLYICGINNHFNKHGIIFYVGVVV